jgi:hypothetical protein
MPISAITLSLLFGISSPVVWQAERPLELPRVIFSLPAGIASEEVQINYFMTGPFGGYGEYVKSEKGKSSYEVVAAVDGRPGQTMKVIAYLPGCEIVTLTFQVQDRNEKILPCRRLGSSLFRGQIVSGSAVRAAPVEVEVRYVATWGHQFFGISDGLVTTIRLATSVPDEGGRFALELPDFYQQKDLGEGEFEFILRRRGSGNIVGLLRPQGQSGKFVGVRVKELYFPVVFLVD